MQTLQWGMCISNYNRQRNVFFLSFSLHIFQSYCRWAVEAISPNIISRNMLKRTKYSLNAVSMDSAIGLINAAIDLGVNIAEIYVDTVGPPDKYQAKLSALFPDFQITVAKKADSTYPIVSAASICEFNSNLIYSNAKSHFLLKKNYFQSEIRCQSDT